ncbi:MAG: ATP-dependent DNA helicase [Bacteroidetes bacterium CG2_30_33_31]|nr:MAG: ATP-dependent DNA helicase [Bacteroidetes bacterium CG2_30_33_31]
MGILDNLNDVQRAAVEYISGPSIIIAGAGSGKTRVITYKIAHLINLGENPFNIIALTFTNKAAREMRNRVETLIGGTEARNVWLGTFHSIFARILRVEAERLGFSSNFTIYDTDDSKSLMKAILKDQQLDDKKYKISTVLNRISTAKTNLISHVEYNNNQELMHADSESGRPKTGMLYTFYQERLRKANAMDFDDLLFNTNILFRDFPDILYKYQKRFQYVLVDEYQDTNFAQYLIVKKLAAANENITVVGDDAQSIYAFRGANIQNILNLEKDYPDLKTFKLEQNYRSTQNIVNIANSIINKNKAQFKKTIWTQNEEGDKLKLNATATDNEEGNLVARQIFDIINREKSKPSSIAILYRTNAQSRALEEALRRINIPYKIFGGMSFYKRKEIKDLLAYFRLAVNSKDEEALKRVINYPKRGIGDTTLDKIKIIANEKSLSLYEIITSINQYISLPQATEQKLLNFAVMIKASSIELKTKNAYDMAMQIAKSSGILQLLYEERNDDEGIMRFENVEELLNGIKDFSESQNDEEGSTELRTLPQFMEDIALYTDADEKDKQEGDFVSLMTIHAAKGLEFPYVFIVGLEENLFPSIMALNSREDIEEERRLFYVALTRGEKQVFLSYANTRYKWGNLTVTEPSRFIQELDTNFIDDETGLFEMEKPSEKNDFALERQSWSNLPKAVDISKNLKKLTKTSENKNTNIDEYEKIQVGVEVYHQRFGKGKVQQVDGIGADKKAIVFFANVGNKNLILRYAKLDLME